MKILNLYAGIGGNRKLWEGHEITAVEINEQIANIYHDYFPNDKIIIADAHQYLLDHYKEYDFIWSSPPCPTHSRLVASNKTTCIMEYPDMKLYQEIILLKYLFEGKFCIENVIPYYKYLIIPNIILGRHPFWCNFYIDDVKFKDDRIHTNITSNSILYGYDLSNYIISGKYGKSKILHNLVNPEIGKYILDQAMNIKDVNQLGLFS